MSDLQALLNKFKAAAEADDTSQHVEVSAADLRLMMEVGVGRLLAEAANREAGDDTLITIPQVCRRLGISRTTLWKLRREGDFPPEIKVSERKIAFSRQTFNEWLEARRA